MVMPLTRMANTPPRPPIQKRTDDELLEELCIKLRFVGCGDYSLPGSETVVSGIREVSSIFSELSARRVDYRQRLERLSEETHWQMQKLLDDCLAFPSRVPYVRETDGIRRALRC